MARLLSCAALTNGVAACRFAAYLFKSLVTSWSRFCRSDSIHAMISSSNQPMRFSVRITCLGNIPAFTERLMVARDSPVMKLTSRILRSLIHYPLKNKSRAQIAAPIAHPIMSVRRNLTAFFFSSIAKSSLISISYSPSV